MQCAKPQDLLYNITSYFKYTSSITYMEIKNKINQLWKWGQSVQSPTNQLIKKMYSKNRKIRKIKKNNNRKNEKCSCEHFGDVVLNGKSTIIKSANYFIGVFFLLDTCILMLESQTLWFTCSQNLLMLSVLDDHYPRDVYCTLNKILTFFISNMLIFVLHQVDLNLFTNGFFSGAASRQLFCFEYSSSTKLNNLNYTADT